MKKNILILILVLCFILTSCTVPEQPVDEKEGAATGPSSVKEESKGADEVTRPKVTISKELKELIDKANSVESLKYAYSSGNDYVVVYVRGNKMKQVFSLAGGTYEPGTRYDTVYLDTSKKTAAAYCEDIDDCDEDEIDKPLSVNYNDFITETPLDVINSITNGEIKEGTFIDKKETVIIETETNIGYDKKIWIWTYTSIPIRYELWKDNEKIKRVDYVNLIVNSVSYSDLVH